MTIEPRTISKRLGSFLPADLKQFQEIFAADLKQYRAADRRYATTLLVVFLASPRLSLHTCFLRNLDSRLLGVGIVLALASDFSCGAGRAEHCHSGQSRSFNDALEECCPECGLLHLDREVRSSAMHCNGRGKSISGKNRNLRKYKAAHAARVLLEAKGLAKQGFADRLNRIQRLQI